MPVATWGGGGGAGDGQILAGQLSQDQRAVAVAGKWQLWDLTPEQHRNQALSASSFHGEFLCAYETLLQLVPQLCSNNTSDFKYKFKR